MAKALLSEQKTAGGSRAEFAVVATNSPIKTGEADDGNVRFEGFEGFEGWTRNPIPDLGRETHRWSGQVLEPVHHTAFIGRNPGSEKVFIVTGDSGQGITHGVVGSLMISDEIMKRSNPWEALYAPDRMSTSAIKTFIAENVTPLKNFGEYLAPGELKSFDDLKPGHGAIVRDGLQKVAAYRDEKDVLSKCSANCTHVGCLGRPIKAPSLETGDKPQAARVTGLTRIFGRIAGSGRGQSRQCSSRSPE